LEPRRFQL